MAHADYDCCAVCDRKLSYSNDANTKAEICPFCLSNLHQEDVLVYTPYEFIEWIITHEDTIVKDVLLSIEFRFCFYPNNVDDNVRMKLGIPPGKYPGDRRYLMD